MYCVRAASSGVVRSLGGRARAHRGPVEAAHLPGGGGVPGAPRAVAPPRLTPARPASTRAHHLGTRESRAGTHITLFSFYYIASQKKLGVLYLFFVFLTV